MVGNFRSDFAGFIMAYERPEVIEHTLNSIFNQTVIPDKILIVDNSESTRVKDTIHNLNNERIEYFKVGYNAGPAGAAKIGLQKLAEQGYDWIYWGDDDDPPHFEDCFEGLLAISRKEIGILGVVGQFFSKRTGEVFRVSDGEIRQRSEVSVDSVAGNQCMIVNADVVRQGCLPDADLFFGFEELDFCIKVKKLNFSLIASSDLFLRSREKFNKLGFKRSLTSLKKKESLKREYYSVRNMIVILRCNKLYLALFYRTIKNLGRAVFGFRKGLGYGLAHAKFILVGIYHGFIHRLGKVY